LRLKCTMVIERIVYGSTSCQRLFMLRLALRHRVAKKVTRRRGLTTSRILVLSFLCTCIISIAEPAFAGPPQTFTVTFVENDSGSDQVSTYELGTPTQPPTQPQTLTLFSKLNPQFSNAGHTFTGWNTAANGSGIAYADGASYTFSADLELFAQWNSSPITYSVTFVENDSGSDPVSTYELGISTQPQTLTLFSKLNPQFSNAGHTFTGWNTAANGSGIAYADGASYTFSADLELFAQWATPSSSQPSPPTQQQTIQVSFVANGGSGTLNSMSGVADSAVTLPTSSSLVRPGYSFTSWNSEADGSGVSYSSGASAIFASSVVLYAQWKAAPTAVLFGDVGVFDKNSTSLTKTLQRQVDQLAAAIRVKKYTKVALYGYTAQTGLDTLNAALSHDRAVSVAQYLRYELHDLHVKGVDISASGEGAISSSTSSLYSRVEVFVS